MYNSLVLLIPSAAFYPSVAELSGLWWGEECICGKPLLWAVDCCRADSNHTHQV